MKSEKQKVMLDRKLKELNDYLMNHYQELRVSKMEDDENYFNLKWNRHYFTGDIEKYICCGNISEIYSTLIGIEYGIKIKQFML